MFEAGYTFGQFKIVRHIGEGGMGEVYLAEDQKLNRQVAIKIMMPDSIANTARVERFQREAKTAARVAHANVMAIYDTGTMTDDKSGDEFAFIVMEHVSGPTLTDVLANQRPTMRELLRVAEKVAQGLAAAHKLGVIHRDIKTDNIKLADDGEPKILDFGLAKATLAESSPDQSESTNTVSRELTEEGKILGTATYMSPEQARGDVVDSRSDIFSFGILLYKMFTGEFPFEGPDRMSRLAKIIESQHLPARTKNEAIPAELERITEKCLRKDPEDRYQDTRDLVVDLRNLRRDFDSGISDSGSVFPGKVSSKGKQGIFAAAWVRLVAAVVAVVIFLGVIQILRSSDNNSAGTAEAAGNLLAVMYFDNLADREDPRRLGEIITNLLITDLSESNYVQVVSSQRLYDVLKALGKEGIKSIDREVSSQVAGKAGARWMLIGSVLQEQPQIIITAQLIEVATGNVIASQRFTGESGEQIFSLVDKLTVGIKNDLSLPAEARAEHDPLVQDLTTSSSEAYRYYLEGVEYNRQWLPEEATARFRQALEEDSTFAMAHYGLSQTLLSRDEQLAAIDKALRYVDKTNAVDKHYILARKAQLDNDFSESIRNLEWITEHHPMEKDALIMLGRGYRELGESEKAIVTFNRVIEIDPTDKLAYNQLAYQYDQMGNFEKSIWAINKYIELAPDEHNPYDSRGDLYSYNGRIDDAIASYRMALEINPHFMHSIEKLGILLLYKGLYAEADSLFQVMASYTDKTIRSAGRYCLAKTPLYQGKLDEAIRLLKIGIETDRFELGNSFVSPDKRKDLLMVYFHTGDSQAGIAESEELERILAEIQPKAGLRLGGIGFRALFHAESGNDRAADSLMALYASSVEDKDMSIRAAFWAVNANLSLLRGRYDSALAYIDNIPFRDISFYFLMLRGRAHLGAGRLGDAVTFLEKALNRYDEDRGVWLIDAVKVHYWLGLAYEESGWRDKAARQYRAFLDIWKNADPEMKEIIDAKTRLNRLEGIS